MKRFISMFMVAVLLLGSSFNIAAAAQQPEVTPLVIVRGMDFGGLIIDQGTDNERPALSVDVATLIFNILKTLTFTMFGGMDAFVGGVMDIAGDIFGTLACDGNGNSVENISVVEYPKNMSHYLDRLGDFENKDGEDGILAEACERYGAEHVYYVTYDWRLDPYETAAKINERVKLALAENKCEKVKIVCCSLGGVMTQAYFDEYGYEAVESCMFLSSAIYGSYCASDPYSGKVCFNKEYINGFLNGALPNLKILWSVLDFTGLTDAVVDLGNDITVNYKDRIYGELMSETFGGCAGLWGMHQTEDFEAAKAYMFKGKEDRFAGVIKKIDKYQQYRLQRDEFLTNMQKDGVEITLVTSYNKPAVPVFDRSYVNSDQVLETELMSAGATVAPYGKTLGDDYVAADPAKLSPDRVVDASTCLFPDNTWFIKNAPHVCCKYGSDVADMLFWLIDYEGRPTVNTNKLYPQFQYCDEEQNLYHF